MPRLILADFLEENGAPERAEFIRLQVQHMPERWGWDDEDEWTPRERELWQQHRAEWLEGLPEMDWCIWGGLVEGVEEDAEAKQLCEARRRIDLRRVKYWFRNRETLLRDMDLLAGVVALRVSGRPLGAAGARTLVQFQTLRNLTKLDLVWNRIGDGGVEALVQFQTLQSLLELYLSGNAIGAVGAQALAQSPILQNLTALDLSDNRIGAAGVEALAKSPYLHNLTTLNLAGNEIGDAGAEALRNSPYLRQCKVVL